MLRTWTVTTLRFTLRCIYISVLPVLTGENSVRVLCIYSSVAYFIWGYNIITDYFYNYKSSTLQMSFWCSDLGAAPLILDPEFESKPGQPADSLPSFTFLLSRWSINGLQGKPEESAVWSPRWCADPVSWSNVFTNHVLKDKWYEPEHGGHAQLPTLFYLATINTGCVISRWF